MGTSSHKYKAKITNLQKRINELQVERDELKAKLQKCEIELETKEQHFERVISNLEQTVFRLKSESGGIRRDLEKKHVLYRKIYNWMIYGVFFSIMPFAVNTLYFWFLGYDTRLSDIIADFLLVLFAISGNLLSILSDEKGSSKFSYLIHLFIMILLIVVLELSIFLSDHFAFMGITPIRTLPISKIFYFSAFFMIVVVILGIIIIMQQNKNKQD